MGVKNEEGEWFRCTPKQVLSAIVAVMQRAENIESRTQTFGLRPEQKAAVLKTAAYLRSCKKDDKKATPHFLWNAKMRFGKTFASYKLAKEMGW
jgi:hypothetical protein